ncbi:MAG: CoA-binding protein [Anaerolineae bacterium]
MTSFEAKAWDFLSQEQIAVAGVSGSGQGAANSIYRKLRDTGYQVFPINPNAETVEGDTCYPNLKSLPQGVDGVVVVTRPELTEQIARECVEAGIPRVWMHYNAFFGPDRTSVSEEAAAMCRDNGITVIAGGCPMMFLEFGHKCMRWLLGVMGRLPE